MYFWEVTIVVADEFHTLSRIRTSYYYIQYEHLSPPQSNVKHLPFQSFSCCLRQFFSPRPCSHSCRKLKRVFQ